MRRWMAVVPLLLLAGFVGYLINACFPISTTPSTKWLAIGHFFRDAAVGPPAAGLCALAAAALVWIQAQKKSASERIAEVNAEWWQTLEAVTARESETRPMPIGSLKMLEKQIKDKDSQVDIKRTLLKDLMTDAENGYAARAQLLEAARDQAVKKMESVHKLTNQLVGVGHKLNLLATEASNIERDIQDDKRSLARLEEEREQHESDMGVNDLNPDHDNHLAIVAGNSIRNTAESMRAKEVRRHAITHEVEALEGQEMRLQEEIDRVKAEPDME